MQGFFCLSYFRRQRDRPEVRGRRPVVALFYRFTRLTLLVVYWSYIGIYQVPGICFSGTGPEFE